MHSYFLVLQRSKKREILGAVKFCYPLAQLPNRNLAVRTPFRDILAAARAALHNFRVSGSANGGLRCGEKEDASANAGSGFPAAPEARSVRSA